MTSYQKIRNDNIRRQLNLYLDERKKNERYIDLAFLCKKFNTTRISMGHFLSERVQERGDIQRTKPSSNYNSSTWEFV